MDIPTSFLLYSASKNRLRLPWYKRIKLRSSAVLFWRYHKIHSVLDKKPLFFNSSGFRKNERTHPGLTAKILSLKH
jgi:hypothetical protein